MGKMYAKKYLALIVISPILLMFAASLIVPAVSFYLVCAVPVLLCVGFLGTWFRVRRELRKFMLIKVYLGVELDLHQPL